MRAGLGMMGVHRPSYIHQEKREYILQLAIAICRMTLGGGKSGSVVGPRTQRIINNPVPFFASLLQLIA